jgi:membrane protein
VVGFSADKVPRLAASLAYYTLFSLAPLLVIVIAIAGFAFGEQAARGQIVGEIRTLVGEQGARAVQSLLENARRPGAGIAATVLGTITLLAGATGAFVELQDALNTIWGVLPRPQNSLIAVLKSRLTSFAVVLGSGFLLLVSLVLSAGLNALGVFVQGRLGTQAAVMEGLNLVLTFAVFTLLLAMIYRMLPDVTIAWSDVWIGAGMTAVLFSIGKFLIGLYLGRSSITSTYGAAGSVVIVLLWVYYSAAILFVGAEFTRAYAARVGTGIAPSRHALRISDVVTVRTHGEYRDESTIHAAAKDEARRRVSDLVNGKSPPRGRENPPRDT